MQKIHKLLSAVLFLIVSGIIYSSLNNSYQAHSSTGGAPSGFSGAPNDGLTCRACHSGPAETVKAGWISSDVPANGYIPGTTYTITATATGAGHLKFGFEISPQNLNGNLLGTLISTSSQTQIIGSGVYITQTSAGTTGSGSKTWTFDWIAPVEGTGTVNFYGAFNVTNSNNGTSGDTIYTSTLTITEFIPPTPEVTISLSSNISCYGLCDGKAIANASGGTPPYTFLWSNNETDSIAELLCEGNNTVTITDASGKTVIDTISITQPDSISVEMNFTSDNGSGNGSAFVAVNGGTPPYNFTWNDPSNQNKDTAVNLVAGVYTVEVTDNNGCITSDSIEVDLLNTGIEYNTRPLELKPFPNPGNGSFRIVANGVKGYIKIDIYDVFGNKVYSDKTFNSGVIMAKTINIPDAKPGLYFIKAESGKKTTINKYIIH